MPRIRSVKPEFFVSPDTAKASYQARILYAALWCQADDYGVGETNLNAILGMSFPDSDGVTRDQLVALLQEIEQAYGVVFYSVKGRYYYQIPSWDDHQKTQRRAGRRFPTPDHPETCPDLRICVQQGNSERPQGNAPSGKGTGEQGNRGTGEVGNAVALRDDSAPTTVVAKPKRAAKQEYRMPDDWVPSEETIIKLMEKHPQVDLVAEAEKCRNHFLSKPSQRRAGWDLTFQTWVNNAVDKGWVTLKGSVRPGRFGTTNDDKVKGWLEMGNDAAAE